LRWDKQQQKSLDEVYDFIEATTRYLERYLNYYDGLRIFRRNINETIKCKKCPPTSNEDKKFEEDVIEALDGDESVFERIHATDVLETKSLSL
jgi:hypothetical protein